MITIKDIAKAANVSPATVSRVLNNGPKVGAKKRAHVQKIIDDLGYRPNLTARALVKQSSGSIGVVIPEIFDPFMAKFAHEIESYASQHDVQTFISSGHNDVEKEAMAINKLLDNNVRSIILHSKVMSVEDIIHFSKIVPNLVLINRNIESIKEKCFWVDNYAASFAITEHLINAGHTKFVYLNSNYDIEDPKERFEGFKAALKAHNIHLDFNIVEYADPFHEGGSDAIQRIIKKGVTFTAIVAYNDQMALGAINYLHEIGINTPKAVSVVGFDDVIYASNSIPKLSTMHYPITEMAIAATTTAISEFIDSDIEQTDLPHCFTPEIIDRDSVKTLT